MGIACWLSLSAGKILLRNGKSRRDTLILFYACGQIFILIPTSDRATFHTFNIKKCKCKQYY